MFPRIRAEKKTPAPAYPFPKQNESNRENKNRHCQNAVVSVASKSILSGDGTDAGAPAGAVLYLGFLPAMGGGDR
jgi:hypothetical protein